MERENRNKLGHWATLSSMAERYDRSTCSGELQLRSDILSAISEGWAPVKSFEIPKPAPNVVSVNDQNEYTVTSNTSVEKGKIGAKPIPSVEPIRTAMVEALPGDGPLLIDNAPPMKEKNPTPKGLVVTGPPPKRRITLEVRTGALTPQLKASAPIRRVQLVHNKNKRGRPRKVRENDESQ